MDRNIDSPNIRKGRFLWMESDEKERFIKELKSKISQGHYFSDAIFSRIVDELAPVIADSVDE